MQIYLYIAQVVCMGQREKVAGLFGTIANKYPKAGTQQPSICISLFVVAVVVVCGRPSWQSVAIHGRLINKWRLLNLEAKVSSEWKTSGRRPICDSHRQVLDHATARYLLMASHHLYDSLFVFRIGHSVQPEAALKGVASESVDLRASLAGYPASGFLLDLSPNASLRVQTEQSCPLSRLTMRMLAEREREAAQADRSRF